MFSIRASCREGETLPLLSDPDRCCELIDEFRSDLGRLLQPTRAFKIAQGAPGSAAFSTVNLDWIAKFRQRALCGADQTRVLDDRFPAQEIADLVGHARHGPTFVATQARGRQWL
jgi:hypothetical protein